MRYRLISALISTLLLSPGIAIATPTPPPTKPAATKPAATKPATAKPTTPPVTKPLPSAPAAAPKPPEKLPAVPAVPPPTTPVASPAAPKPAAPAPATAPIETTPVVTPATQPVRLVIRLSKRRVFYYEGTKEITSYPIAVGKKGWETPRGNFSVINMVRDPAWQHPWNGSIIPPGLDNPLGDRWIGFWSDGKNMIGFHGTPNEESVGRAASHGCIRMKNNDVRALFEKVAVGIPVIVEP